MNKVADNTTQNFSQKIFFSMVNLGKMSFQICSRPSLILKGQSKNYRLLEIFKCKRNQLRTAGNKHQGYSTEQSSQISLSPRSGKERDQVTSLGPTTQCNRLYNIWHTFVQPPSFLEEQITIFLFSPKILKMSFKNFFV